MADPKNDETTGTQSLTTSVPFPRSYWVLPGQFLAGCYPGSLNEEEAGQKLKGLLEHGIRHVINLMEPDELDWSGKPFEPYEGRIVSLAASMGRQVSVERMPIEDTWVPTKEGMSQILDRVDQSIQNNRSVYIHCWGGRGRTGTVVGCYFARRCLASGSKALELIRTLRKTTADYDSPSPETTRQMNMVLSWKEGE